MKRWAGLIIGVAVGVLLTGIGLYAIAWLWPRPAGLQTTPIASVQAGVTELARPTHTPAPAEAATPNSPTATTEEPLVLQKLVRNATPTAATSASPRAGGASWLPIPRLSLQSPYEAQGFDFQQTQLGDNRDRWVAASPDGLALVEIVGAEAVEQASVIVFGPIRRDAAGGGQRAIYMLTLMHAVLPGWSEGAAWFGAELVNASRQPGDYESEITHDGVRVTYSVDTSLGSITLSFEPE